MTEKRYTPIDNLTPSVVDAILEWNEYLSGKTNWNHGTMAAHMLFTIDLDAPWSPMRSASAEEVDALTILAKAMEGWRKYPWFMTQRQLMLVYQKTRLGVDFIRESMGLAVHYDPAPRPKLLSRYAPSHFAHLKRHLEHHMAHGKTLIGGIPARTNLIPPEGFVVKGNSKTAEFLLPAANGYDYFEHDLWFLNLETAEDGLKRPGLVPNYP